MRYIITTIDSLNIGDGCFTRRNYTFQIHLESKSSTIFMCILIILKISYKLNIETKAWKLMWLIDARGDIILI